MSALPLLAIVARPGLAEADRVWIEAIRAEHDPQAGRIGQHVTLAFPAPVPVERARAELDAACAATAPFPCVLERFEAVREPGTHGGHVYFVPTAGRAALEGLHDRFYRGAFRAHFRAEPPYVPHVTLAANPDHERCVELARALATGRRVVRGIVAALELVAVGPERVARLASAALRGASASP